jgi:hypothetical protein
MRKGVFALLGLLNACAASQPPVHGVTAGHHCQASGTESFVGKLRSDEVGADIMKATGASVIRWAPPGVMLTMDFRDDRVTVYVSPDRKISRIACG